MAPWPDRNLGDHVPSLRWPACDPCGRQDGQDRDGLVKPVSFPGILRDQDDQAAAEYLPFAAADLAADSVVLVLFDAPQNAGKFAQPARERCSSRFRQERRFLSHKDAQEVHRQRVEGLEDEKSKTLVEIRLYENDCKIPEGKKQYLSDFLSASSSAALLSVQQKCP